MKLTCLSIQQPFADLVIAGCKPVENRSWTWMKDRNWHKEGSLLLAIHASGTVAQLTKAQLDELVPDWEDASPVGKCVIGIVDLIQICRPSQLPNKLRNHPSVNGSHDNWCWVLENPRKLATPFPAKGNARLFYVDIPSNLLPKGLCVSQE